MQFNRWMLGWSFLVLAGCGGGGAGGNGPVTTSIPLASSPIMIGGRGASRAEYVAGPNGALLTWSVWKGSGPSTSGKLQDSSSTWGPEVLLGYGTVGGVATEGQLGYLLTSGDGYTSDAALFPPNAPLSSSAMFSLDDIGKSSSGAQPFALGNGKGLLLWRDDSNRNGLTICGRNFTPGAGWGTKYNVFTQQGSDPFLMPQGLMDESGNLHAFSILSGYTRSSIWTKALTMAGWTAQLELDPTNADPFVSGLQLVKQPGGGLIAGWVRASLTGQKTLFTSQFNVSTGWGQPVVVTTGVNFFSPPKIDVFTDGRLALIWSEMGNQKYAIKYVERDSHGTWGQVETIMTKDSIGFDADIPEVALKTVKDGDLLVAWTVNQRDSGAPPYKLHRLNLAKRTNGTWSAPFAVDPNGLGDSSSITFKQDSKGRTLLFWKEWTFLNGSSDDWCYYAPCN